MTYKTEKLPRLVKVSEKSNRKKASFLKLLQKRKQLEFKAVQTKLSMFIHSKPSLATVSSITKLVSDAFLLGTWLESFHLEKNFSSRLLMLNS